MAEDTPNPAYHDNAEAPIGIPAGAVTGHPTSAIPLPAHGLDTLNLAADELAAVAAVDVINRAALVLTSAAAEKLGLSPNDEPDLDLDEARKLITALAGLLAASEDFLGEQGEALRDGLRTLQNAFREVSAYPDAPGEGPGEQLVR